MTTPPICVVCGAVFANQYFHTGRGGELVKSTEFEPLSDGMCGHPRGLLWVCDEHLQAVRRHAHLTADAAIARIREDLRIALPQQEQVHGELPPPQLWLREIGPRPTEVFIVLRQALQIPAHAVLPLLKQRDFVVDRGWPDELAPLREAFLAAGATVEIEYDPQQCNACRRSGAPRRRYEGSGCECTKTRVPRWRRAA